MFCTLSLWLNSRSMTHALALTLVLPFRSRRLWAIGVAILWLWMPRPADAQTTEVLTGTTTPFTLQTTRDIGGDVPAVTIDVGAGTMRVVVHPELAESQVHIQLRVPTNCRAPSPGCIAVGTTQGWGGYCSMAGTIESGRLVCVRPGMTLPDYWHGLTHFAGSVAPFEGEFSGGTLHFRASHVPQPYAGIPDSEGPWSFTGTATLVPQSCIGATCAAICNVPPPIASWDSLAETLRAPLRANLMQQIQDATDLEGISKVPNKSTQTDLQLQYGFVTWPKVEQQLDISVAGLQAFAAAGGPRPRRTSGYRPPLYQAHFLNLAETSRKLKSAMRDPGQADACRALLNEVDADIARHELALDEDGVPIVGIPGLSGHQTGTAIDLEISAMARFAPKTKPGPLDEIIKQFALARGTPKDPVHFIKAGGKPSRWIRVKARGSAAAMIADPTGKRFGVTGAGVLVNEIGETAIASGLQSGLAVFDIFQPLPGTYDVSGIGTALGPFSLHVYRMAEHDQTETASIAGTTMLGQPLPHIGGIVDAAGELTVPPGLRATLNANLFEIGQTMEVVASLTLPIASSAVDAYVVVQLPPGQMLSLQVDGSLVPGIVPLARGFAPFAIEALLAQYTFNGSEPKGSYTWYSVLTRPGTLEFVSPLAATVFTVK